MKLEQLTDIDVGNTSEQNFRYFGRLSTKSQPFLIQKPATINQKQI